MDFNIFNWNMFKLMIVILFIGTDIYYLVNRYMHINFNKSLFTVSSIADLSVILQAVFVVLAYYNDQLKDIFFYYIIVSVISSLSILAITSRQQHAKNSTNT